MRKILSILLTLTLVLGALMMLGANASAEEATPITIPEFDFPTRPYETKSELNIPIDEIVALFPQELEIKYENGKVMVKDFGAAKVESSYDWPSFELELVDGWWTYAVAEEEYEDFVKYISVYGKDNSWDLFYIDGKADPWLNLYEGSSTLSINIHSKTVDVTYYVDGNQYRDYYSGELFIDHCAVTYLTNGDELNMGYDFSGKVLYIRLLHTTGIWYYYSPETGWTSDLSQDETTELPEPYTGYTIDQFVELSPPLDFCEHEWVDATCETPKTCDICGETEGEALGHSYEAVVTEPNCEDKGYTTHTCSVCGDAYTSDEVDALGHSWKDATTEAPKTCESCGETEGEPLPKPEEPDTPDKPNEVNWFVRIWNAILDFFRRLFGKK